MAKHFFMVMVMAIFASLAIRLLVTNAPITAEQAGLR